LYTIHIPHNLLGDFYVLDPVIKLGIFSKGGKKIPAYQMADIFATVHTF
jgi:hypothetical protein